MALDLVSGLIEQCRHLSSYPVDLSPIYDLFTVRYLPLSTALLGFGYRGDPESLIGVNANLDRPAQRMALCHEAAHLLLRHPNSLYLCRLNDWLYFQYEMIAQETAASILLPREPLLALAMEGASYGELAEAFQVPEILVRLRLRPFIGQI